MKWLGSWSARKVRERRVAAVLRRPVVTLNVGALTTSPASSAGSINFLHADCEKFRHPLLHIQKTPDDCPVIAIDSFRHMYVFPDFKDLTWVPALNSSSNLLSFYICIWDCIFTPGGPFSSISLVQIKIQSVISLFVRFFFALQFSQSQDLTSWIDN